MNELIKIDNRDGKETCNARELHTFLKSKQDFSNWIKNRVNKYGFIENNDYIRIEGLSTINVSSSKARSQKTIEYYLTLDMAKELSMVENNEKGKEARRYFIACENTLKENKVKIPDFNNPALAARAWADEYEKKQLLQTRLDIVEPKAALADQALRDKTEHYSITDAGKHLGINQKLMFQVIRDHGLLTQKRLPTQKALNYGVLLERTSTCPDGRNRKQAVMDMSCIFEFKRRYVTSQLELVK